MAIQQVHTRTAGSSWQVCLTLRQQGGFLPLSVIMMVYRKLENIRVENIS